MRDWKSCFLQRRRKKMSNLDEYRLGIITTLDAIGLFFIIYLFITSSLVYSKVRKATVGCSFSSLPYCFRDAIRHSMFGIGLSCLLLALEIKWLLDSTLLYKYPIYTWHWDHILLLGCVIYVSHWALWTLRAAYGRAQRGCQGDCSTCFEKAKAKHSNA